MNLESVTRVRKVKPGQRFILLRTGEVYTYLRLEIRTPSGMRHVVERDGRETSLHHSCHVEVLNVDSGSDDANRSA